ncbi:MAG: circularly permuted type 2 ATP-grasp protein [Microbacteriaceae bacterium]|nr:circularly permuted type 2 ATP-grasp protein [Microbacteriaceae bacterium]
MPRSAEPSAEAEARAAALLDEYRAALAAAGPAAAPRVGVDELVTADGVHPGSEGLVETLLRHGHAELARARRRAEHYLDDDGVTYGTAPDGAAPGPWRVDPLPVIIDGAEWTALEAGLEQRARLLRLVLDDVYGEQRLLRERRIPAEIVLGHRGYVRAAHGVPASRRPLVTTATDLGRDAAGAWAVFDDRTQAPSGAGYAMATRRIVAQLLPRLHRDTDVAKLRGFFHTMTAAILAAAPEHDGVPRTVLLSPGAASETAFDQAFTASLLGFPLVEADDLQVRAGRVQLRASHGLVPVDAVLRRVDETWADPLELRGDSRLGVAGLVESVRSGSAVVINPIGAGVLENPGLQPYLPALAEHLLGEPLALPGAETWWCGDDAGRAHVLANLERLVLKPIHRDEGDHATPGWLLTAAELDEHRARIEAEPWAWTGQAPLPLSTAPVVGDAGLEPRRFVLRAFGVRLGDEHVIMPGGLGRVGTTPDELHITSGRGALAKDVWVVGGPDDLGLPVIERVGQRRPRVREALGFEITPRGADNLYWFGRYTERTDATVRLLAVANDLANDHGAHPDTPGAAALARILDAVARLLAVRRPRAGEPLAQYLRGLVSGRESAGTVASSIDRLELAAQYVRELVSGDTWPVLASLVRARDDVPGDADELQAGFDELLGPLLALQGIVAHGLYRDESWAFVDAGIRMERAQFTLGLVRAALGEPQSPLVEYLVSEAVLGVGDSTMTNRRRIAVGLGPAGQVESTLDLLVAERDNPRSARFQAVRIARNLRVVGDDELAERMQALADELAAIDVDAVTDRRAELVAAATRALDELRAVSAAIEARHFRRQAPQADFQQRWYGPGSDA